MTAQTSIIADKPTTLHLDKRAGNLIEAAASEVKNNGASNDDLLTTPETAMWLGVSRQWLEIGRIKNYGPTFVRLSAQAIRYKRSDVIEWLKAREHSHTAEYATDVKRGKQSKKAEGVRGRPSKKKSA